MAANNSDYSDNEMAQMARSRGLGVHDFRLQYLTCVTCPCTMDLLDTLYET